MCKPISGQDTKQILVLLRAFESSWFKKRRTAKKARTAIAIKYYILSN